MESWIAFLNILSTAGFVLALTLILLLLKGKLGVVSRMFLGLSVGLYVLVGLSNTLEHLEISAALDVYEDYFEILFLPFFLFFFFSFHMDQQFKAQKRVEEALFEQKERAQVTLACIGDAVIATDPSGRVEYLNATAEALTGWRVDEARGQTLGNVFRIVNELTREPAQDPVARCLREGHATGLANHTVLIRRDGKEFSIADSAAPIRNRAGQTIGVVLVFRDVTEARQLQRQLAYDASHDVLTGLVNRREFEIRLEHCLASAKKHDVQHTLCYLDLDQFKVINDTVGHNAGDALLKQIAYLLRGLFRQRDTLARLGGDEFGLLLEYCPLEKAVRAVNKIIKRLQHYQFVWEGRTFQVGVSIGLVVINSQTESISQALSEADVACYTAKDLGRGRLHIYHPTDSETAKRHGAILQAAELQQAIEKNLFQLYCQPVMPLNESGEHQKFYEVLLRLKGAEGQMILPNSFILAAERYGLMTNIDRWVIRAVLSALAGQTVSDGLRIFINLSGNSLNDETLLDYVREKLEEFQTPPSQLCFEITETAAIHNLEKAQLFVSEVQRLGVRVALDDFGSGLSSFRYLKRLSVDYLKIDGSFVEDMFENQNDQAMVAAIHQVGHIMGISTVAEHVEQKGVIGQLREMGVDYAQGYAFGEPLPLAEALKQNTAQ